MIAASLSGGSTKGIAHVAALEAIDQARINLSILIGSSVGSIIAFAYATNKLHLVKKLFLELQSKTMFSQPPMTGNGKVSLSAYWNLLRKGHMAELDNLEKNLRKIIFPIHHEHMPIEVFAASVDLKTGGRIVYRLNDLDYDDAIRAVIASCSIPVFNPIQDFENKSLVDGGVRMHNPGHWLLEEVPGISRLISVYTRPESPALPHWENGNVIRSLMRTIDIMNVEISKGDEIKERYLTAQLNIELQQIFMPSVLENLYDTDHTRLRQLYHEAKAITKSKLATA